MTRDEVTSLGAVLAADAPGRSDPEAVTLFDSTGLAIQDCDGRDVDRRARHLYSRSIGELRGAA